MDLTATIINAIEEWKRTGLLPNGEFWQPSDGIKKSVPRNEPFVHVNGLLLDEYYRVVCSRASIRRRASQIVLFYLEDRGLIEINWRCPHGAKIYPVRSLKKKTRK